jgi:mRNA interferase RelE/StbE
MAWRIELDRVALGELDRLDPQVSQRILDFLHRRLAKLNDPRSIGESLKGSKLGDLWKYRVGDCRIIADIDDGAVRVLIVQIGHRREVYR